MKIGERYLVSTIKDKCKMCYTCIRECPAKAIRVLGSQSEVMTERCIGCGQCVRVCVKKAKRIYSSTQEIKNLLASNKVTVAVIAPSFPAEFPELNYRKVVGAIKQLGFAEVFEVSFGADIVAKEYAKILATSEQRYIGSTCPAMVSFITKYYPELTKSLMPVVSPMIAIARVARKKLGNDINVVFIGPCVAKKAEALDSQVANDVNSAMTFSELQELFTEFNIDVHNVIEGEFAEPRGNLGGLFAVSRGLLQAANLPEDLLNGEILVAEGQQNFSDAMSEFKKDTGTVRLLEILCCNGCIMGVGFSNSDPMLVKRSHVSKYVKKRTQHANKNDLEEALKQYEDIEVTRQFIADDQRFDLPVQGDLTHILNKMDKYTPDDELNCGACGYNTCRSHATAILKGLAEPEMCLPYTIDHLRSTVVSLENMNTDLLETKEALVKSEKLASMGQLAAGIAHEVNNPLGIIILYANLLLEEYEHKAETTEDLRVVLEQANRCKKIVMGLLNFARQNKIYKAPTNTLQLVKKSLSLSQIPSHIDVQINNKLEYPNAFLDPDQILQVLHNLIDNALASMTTKGELTITLENENNNVKFIIQDTGSGIEKENLSKVFEPFFTTKPVGKGTGLGLPVVHGIVKMHSGQISVDSNTNPNEGIVGTCFTVIIPDAEEKNL